MCQHTQIMVEMNECNCCGTCTHTYKLKKQTRTTCIVLSTMQVPSHSHTYCTYCARNSHTNTNAHASWRWIMNACLQLSPPSQLTHRSLNPILHLGYIILNFSPALYHDPVTSLSFYSSIPSLPPPCVWIRVDPRSLTLNSFDPRESWSWLFPCFYSSLGKLGNASNICVCVCLCVHVRFYKCHFVLPAYGSPEDKHTTIVLSYRVLVVKCLTLRKTIYQHTLNPHTPKLTHSWISLSLYLSFCLSFN